MATLTTRNSRQARITPCKREKKREQIVLTGTSRERGCDGEGKGFEREGFET